MKRIIAALLLAVMIFGCCSATVEAGSRPNFWTELDITFWQTVPFAAFWSYAVALQFTGGGMVDWNTILAATAAISSANAFVHARKVVAQPSPGR